MSRMSGNNVISIASSVNTSFSNTFTGPFGSGQALTVLVSQIGNQVTIEVPGVAAAPAIASVAVGGTAVAAAFRPQALISVPITVVNNVVRLPAAGKAEITTAGVINVYLDLLGTAAWLAVGNNGWDRFSISYIIA